MYPLQIFNEATTMNSSINLQVNLLASTVGSDSEHASYLSLENAMLRGKKVMGHFFQALLWDILISVILAFVLLSIISF